MDSFIERIREALAEQRGARVVDLAVGRGLLTPARRAELGNGPRLDEELLARGWISREQLAELRREADRSRAPLPLLNRYELGELIGEGAMSQVFRGMDLQLRRPVAIKVLREKFLFHAAGRERFA